MPQTYCRFDGLKTYESTEAPDPRLNAAALLSSQTRGRIATIRCPCSGLAATIYYPSSNCIVTEYNASVVYNLTVTILHIKQKVKCSNHVAILQPLVTIHVVPYC